MLVLDVSLGDLADDLHAISAGHLVKARGIGLGSGEQGLQFVEVADHRGRAVQVELPARDVADAEPVAKAGGDVDERPSRAGELAILEEDDVLAVEDVEASAASWWMCIGGPKPAGSVASNSENAVPVSSAVAFTTIVKSPMSMRRPSPGSSTNARWVDSGTPFLLLIENYGIRGRRLVHPAGPDRPLLGQSTLRIEARDVDPARDRRRAGRPVETARLESRDQASAIRHLIDDTKHRSGICGSVLRDQARVGSRVSVAVLEMEHVPAIVRGEHVAKALHGRPVPDFDDCCGGRGRVEVHADQRSGDTC